MIDKARHARHAPPRTPRQPRTTPRRVHTLPRTGRFSVCLSPALCGQFLRATSAARGLCRLEPRASREAGHSGLRCRPACRACVGVVSRGGSARVFVPRCGVGLVFLSVSVFVMFSWAFAAEVWFRCGLRGCSRSVCGVAIALGPLVVVVSMSFKCCFRRRFVCCLRFKCRLNVVSDVVLFVVVVSNVV